MKSFLYFFALINGANVTQPTKNCGINNRRILQELKATHMPWKYLNKILALEIRYLILYRRILNKIQCFVILCIAICPCGWGLVREGTWEKGGRGTAREEEALGWEGEEDSCRNVGRITKQLWKGWTRSMPLEFNRFFPVVQGKRIQYKCQNIFEMFDLF